MEEEVVAEGLSVADWVSAGTVLLIGIVLGRVLQYLMTRRMKRDDAEPPAANLVGRFAGYAFVLAGLVYALAILEIRLGPLLGAIGIGGIAVAFAAQSILSNFLASILLQVRRPFKRGDQICTNDCEGEVEEVNFRTVILRTYDGERALVPCAEVLDSPIINYTFRGRRRTTLDIGVSYDADLQQARDVIEKAVRAVDGVLAEPAPEALVEEFGDSSINLAVRFWHAPDIASMWNVRSEVAVAAKRALDDADLEIPFPHRVILVPPGSDGSAPDRPKEDRPEEDGPTPTNEDRPVEPDRQVEQD
jgi:small conductance mechanosensitive channel